MNFINIFLCAAFAMDNQPNDGQATFMLPLPPAPPGIAEDLHRALHHAATQAYNNAYNHWYQIELQHNYLNDLQHQLHTQNSYYAPVQQNEVQHQLHSQNSYHAPVQQNEDTDDTPFFEDPINWSNEEMMERIKQENGSKSLQNALEFQLAAKDRIVEFFDSLNTDEIMELSHDKSANYAMSAAIMYADYDVVERFVEKLNANPQSIEQISANNISYKVMISLIVRMGESLEEYDGLVSVALEYTSKINPYVIQQLIKNVPSYKYSLLVEIKEGKFPEEEISSEHIPILGMYDSKELGDILVNAATEKVNERKKGRNPGKRDWEYIHQNTLKSSIPKFLDPNREKDKR